MRPCASAACAAAMRGARRGRRRLADLHVDDPRACASSAAAAAITSMTMNGGTSLRPEGVSRRFAASSMHCPASVGRATRPAVAVFPASVAIACVLS